MVRNHRLAAPGGCSARPALTALPCIARPLTHHGKSVTGVPVPAKNVAARSSDGSVGARDRCRAFDRAGRGWRSVLPGDDGRNAVGGCDGADHGGRETSIRPGNRSAAGCSIVRHGRGSAAPIACRARRRPHGTSRPLLPSRRRRRRARRNLRRRGHRETRRDHRRGGCRDLGCCHGGNRAGNCRRGGRRRGSRGGNRGSDRCPLRRCGYRRCCCV
jgi:hypothetical protein